MVVAPSQMEHKMPTVFVTGPIAVLGRASSLNGYMPREVGRVTEPGLRSLLWTGGTDRSHR